MPCSPLYKEKELEYQLRDSGAAFVVAANDVVKGNDLFASLEACRARLDLKGVIAASVTDYLPGFKRPLVRARGGQERRAAGHDLLHGLVRSSGPLEKSASVDPLRDVAVLQYTGGTTGVSKGAMLSHANLYLNGVATSGQLPLGPRDVALAVLPLFHIYGMTTAMNAPLYVGLQGRTASKVRRRDGDEDHREGEGHQLLWRADHVHRDQQRPEGVEIRPALDQKLHLRWRRPSGRREEAVHRDHRQPPWSKATA